MSSTNSWGSSSATTLNDTGESPCEVVNGVPLDWSGKGTSHVEYAKSDTLPLAQGRFLGHGINGGVYETTCNGIALAWKRKFCSRRFTQRERREIEIIKRLQHKHIIRLVGTYTHGPFLGLLLWPVATCDLATLIEDVDWLQRQFRGENQMEVDDEREEDSEEQIHDRQARLNALGVSTESMERARVEATGYLESTMGCIASAVAYLHKQEIKHKDLKPSNILLSAKSLHITDFGTATDFSVLTTSATENGERGTPKYFAPEVAVFEPSGRAADIFSMGCIFLEIITLCVGYTLEETKSLRVHGDKSFHSNLEVIFAWFNSASIFSRTCADDHFMGLVRRMLQEDPSDRLTAENVHEHICMINGLAQALSVAGGCRYTRSCCDTMAGDSASQLSPNFHKQQAMSEYTGPFDMTLIIGNVYELVEPNLHTYTFFVQVSNPDVIEKLHIYIHQSFPNFHRILTEHPFVFQGRGWGSFDISVYVVLKQGCDWRHPYARALPGESKTRMLPMFWELNFAQPRTTQESHVSYSNVWAPTRD